jgi:NCS1 family nucleobase:cation symporter-1
VGFWATLALNIPDFTRFVRSQKDQVIGQALGMPTTMTFISFIGIITTSATVIVFGQAIWNPIDLVNKFGTSYLVIIPLLGLIIATICCNMAANLVSSANDFSNLFPKRISFKKGGYITCIIGLLILPWKLIADPHGYIFRWLIAYSALLGAVGGVMVADYYVIRRTKLKLSELFNRNGIYSYDKGWNLKAFLTLFIAVLPNLPGFLVQVDLISQSSLPIWIDDLYNYAWFISFFISFVLYSIIMKKN